MYLFEGPLFYLPHIPHKMLKVIWRENIIHLNQAPISGAYNLIFFFNGGVCVLEFFHGYGSINYCCITNHPKLGVLKQQYLLMILWDLASWLLSWLHLGSLIKLHSAGELAGLEDPRCLTLCDIWWSRWQGCLSCSHCEFSSSARPGQLS